MATAAKAIPRLAVLGGGVSGLAAAYAARYVLMTIVYLHV